MLNLYTLSFSVKNQHFLCKTAQTLGCVLAEEECCKDLLMNVKHLSPNEQRNIKVEYCLYHHPCIKVPTNAEQTDRIYSSFFSFTV